jgi:O-antigen ligase
MRAMGGTQAGLTANAARHDERRPRRWKRRDAARSAARAGWFSWAAALTILVMFWELSPFTPVLSDLNTTIITEKGGFVAPVAEDAASGWLRLSWLVVYAVCFGLAATRLRQLWTEINRHSALVLLTGWTWLSTVWSISPDDTLRRAFAITATTLFGIYVGCRFSQRTVVRLVGTTALLGIVASLVFVAVDPERGATTLAAEGAWRGVFINKNALGGVMLFGALAFFVQWRETRRLFHLLCILAALTLMLLSQAKTPAFIGLAMIPATIIVQRYYADRHRFALLLGAAFGLLLVVSVTVLPNADSILAFVGKDPTLTGRTTIWQLSWDAIQERFWLGYGYDAFWTAEGPAAQIWAMLNWRTPNSHNGILEQWLSLGIIGVVPLLWLFYATTRNIVLVARTAASSEMIWAVGLLMIFVGYSASEASSMVPNDLKWVLLCALSVAAARAADRLARETTPMMPGKRPLYVEGATAIRPVEGMPGPWTR